MKEEDAYPADPEDGYGWEKLFSERMCRHFREDFGLETRVARYHNVYGPHGTFNGGREKAPQQSAEKLSPRSSPAVTKSKSGATANRPAASCSSMTALHGTRALMESDIVDPINIGSSEMVTINRLVDLAEEIAGIKVKRNYKLDAPKGVRGRSSDNTLIKSKLGWEPSTPLRTGLEKTYAWIFDQMKNGGSTSLI